MRFGAFGDFQQLLLASFQYQPFDYVQLFVNTVRYFRLSTVLSTSSLDGNGKDTWIFFHSLDRRQ